MDYNISKLELGDDESKLNSVYLKNVDLKKYNYSLFCKLLSYNLRLTHSEERTRMIKDCDNNIIYLDNFKNSFRIMSYNVHNFVNLCKDINPAKNFDIFLKLFKNVNPDIVCLQEVVPILKDELKESINSNNLKDFKINYKHIVSEMKKVGYKYSFIIDSNKNYNIRVTDKNEFQDLVNCYYPLSNVIFSKFKLNNPLGYKLPGSRSILISDVKINDTKFILINTHLEYTNKYKNTEYLKNKYDKTHIIDIQINMIIKIIEHEKKNRNINTIILCGDLNNQINNLPLLKSYFKYGKTGSNTSSFKNNKIDFILLNDNKDVEILNEDVINIAYSDHLPLYTDFVLKKMYDTDIDYYNKIKYTLKNLNYQKYYYLYDDIYMDRRYISINISDNVLKNLHFNKNWYYNEHLEPLIINKIYDYYSPILSIYKTYKAERFKDLSVIAKNITGGEVTNNNILNDEIILYYCMTRPNIKTIVLWPNTRWNESKNKDKLMKTNNFLRHNGYIYYTKTIYLNFKEAQSLIYQLYLTTNRNKDLKSINYHTVAKGWSDKSVYKKVPIKVYFYEYKKDQSDITGTQAYFKNILRNIWTNNDKEIYNILHISDYFSEAIDNCKLFLNKNSLDMLSKQIFTKYIYLQNSSTIFLINSLKKVLLSNFSQMHHISFMLISSINLYILGLRSVNDIDGIIMSSDFFMKRKNLETYKKFFNISSKDYLPFIDFALKGTSRYEDYLDEYYKYLSYIIGADNINNVILDPKYHYYFFGLKIPILEFDIIKRLNRYRPKSISDIILYSIYTNKKIKIPQIPTTKKVFDNNGIAKYVNINKNKFLEQILRYLKQNKIIITKKKLLTYFTDINLPLDIIDIDLDEIKIIYKKLGVKI